MLCYVMLCYVMLCYVMLCYATLQQNIYVTCECWFHLNFTFILQIFGEWKHWRI